MLRSSAFRGAAARVFSSVKTAKPMIRSAPSSLPKRFMAHGDVKRHPDLERWNNVRDNIDQVFDISDPGTLVRAVIFGALIPYGVYELIIAEGLNPNGDSSTGILVKPDE